MLCNSLVNRNLSYVPRVIICIAVIAAMRMIHFDWLGLLISLIFVIEHKHIDELIFL